MLFKKDNLIYLYENNRYYVADIIKTGHTIAIVPTSQFVEVLEGAEEVSFDDVKKRYL
jgi:hypothetical protein